MIRNGFVVVGTLVALVLAAGGCASDGTASGGSTSPTATASQATSPLEMAQESLLANEEVPLPPPSTEANIQDPYTAEGDQVGAPWRQFMLCSTVQMPDEGPPITAEPGAAAGAWAFGSTITPDEPGYTQIDQYAIVYVDEAAARAAVERSRALTDSCDEAIETWASPGQTWTYQEGAVPESVEGFRLIATFTADEGESVQDEVSTVMRSGRTVHYLRFDESSGGGRDGMLDPAYVEELIGAVAENMVG